VRDVPRLLACPVAASVYAKKDNRGDKPQRMRIGLSREETGDVKGPCGGEQRQYLHSVYLVYWDKSTNPEAAHLRLIHSGRHGVEVGPRLGSIKCCRSTCLPYIEHEFKRARVADGGTGRGRKRQPTLQCFYDNSDNPCSEAWTIILLPAASLDVYHSCNTIDHQIRRL
jgi:hypothetical protein